MKKVFLSIVFTFSLFSANSSFAMSCVFEHDSSIEKIINKLNVIGNIKLLISAINDYNDNYNDSDFVFIGEIVDINCDFGYISICNNDIKIEKILKGSSESDDNITIIKSRFCSPNFYEGKKYIFFFKDGKNIDDFSINYTKSTVKDLLISILFIVVIIAILVIIIIRKFRKRRKEKPKVED